MRKIFFTLLIALNFISNNLFSIFSDEFKIKLRAIEAKELTKDEALKLNLMFYFCNKVLGTGKLLDDFNLSNKKKLSNLFNYFMAQFSKVSINDFKQTKINLCLSHYGIKFTEDMFYLTIEFFKILLSNNLKNWEFEYTNEILVKSLIFDFVNKKIQFSGNDMPENNAFVDY
ncbi:hypothetical protein GF322_01480 [Candidatus Dependentiae bacterium]|nr:hypothetical protein [Candidatus Dependentiae bacterium]